MILFLGLVMTAVFGGIDYFSIESLRSHKLVLTQFVDKQYFFSAMLFVLIYAIAAAFSLPGAAVLTLTGGYLYGVLIGAVFSVTAATIGACVLFFAARTAFHDFLKLRVGSALGKMREGFQKNSFSYLLFLRLVPVFPFFLVNLVPAFLHVRFRTYFFASFIGMLPGAIAFSLIGAGLDKVFERKGTINISSLMTSELLFGLIGLGTLSLSPAFYKWIRKMNAGKQTL